MDEPFESVSSIKRTLRDKIGHRRNDANAYLNEAAKLEKQAGEAYAEAIGMELALDLLTAIEFPK